MDDDYRRSPSPTEDFEEFQTDFPVTEQMIEEALHAFRIEGASAAAAPAGIPASHPLGAEYADAAPAPKVLSSLDLKGIAQFIKEGKAKNIIFMTGAGISVSAGIPDFRSDDGIYHRLGKYHLPTPESVFDLDFFKQDPAPFFDLAKDLIPGRFQPTKAHFFIKLLDSKGLLLRDFTQNIDTLEHVAGIPEEKVVYAHGSFLRAHCVQCHKEHPWDYVKTCIEAGTIPKCQKELPSSQGQQQQEGQPPAIELCSGVVKPDIVFFHENLPENFYTRVQEDFPKCDLLIVMGTSLQVMPFASLLGLVGTQVPRLLLNRMKVGGGPPGFLELLGMTNPGSFDFDGPLNTRDVFCAGDCDDGVQLLANELGLGQELLDLCASKK